MKDLKPKIIELFKQGNCTPQITVLAKELKEPSATIHYNVKQLEKEGLIKTYKAVFNYKKINQGYCSYVFITLSPEDYAHPEKIGKALAEDARVESVDVASGEQELIVKLRAKDVEEYYAVTSDWIKKYKLKKITNMTSLHQIKSEFIKLE
jgi:Lrp/AsnC family leucine-responsive transcriptional regulator